MKNFFLKSFVLAALFTFGWAGTASAQYAEDVKINVLGSIFGNYGVSFEHALNEQMSIGLGAAYYRYTASSNGEDFVYTGFNTTPEFRFYFNEDKVTAGFFAGPYAKVRMAQSNGWQYYQESSQSWQETYRRSTGAALGVVGGKKWVANAGFIFETYFGIGRYLVNNVSYSTQEAENYWEDGTLTVAGLSRLDLRLGLAIGWRFGS